MRCVAALAALVPVLAGCSSGQPANPLPTWPVTGVVTYNGQPLAEASVIFNFPEHNRSSFGKTNEEGVFRLTTFQDNDGAPAGSAQITVIKTERLKPLDLPRMGEPGYDPIKTEAAYAKLPPPKSLLPARYGNPEKSGLTATIEARDDHPQIKLELKD